MRNFLQPRMPLSQDARRRASGFTLLELLLSLALTAVLLGLVFTSLEMHWRFSTTGQEDAERAQVARMVFQRMAADIRSTVYRPDKAAGTSTDDSESTDGSNDGSGTSTSGSQSSTGNSSSTGGSGASTQQMASGGQGGGSGSSSQTSQMQPVAAPTDAFAGKSLGLFGDSQTIVMHVARPTRLLGVNPTDTPFAMSDLRAVSYYLAGPNGEMPAVFATGTAAVSGGDTYGLARKNADYLSLSLTEAASQVSPTDVGVIEQLAPEIVSVSFKYHDGFEWLSSWDSVEKGGLPVAIGITIGFREPRGTSTSVVHRETSASTQEFRIVVALPASNPFSSIEL